MSVRLDVREPQETRSRGARVAIPRHAPPPALHLEQCDDMRIIEMICATAGTAPAGDEKPVGAAGVEAPPPLDSLARQA